MADPPSALFLSPNGVLTSSNATDPTASIIWTFPDGGGLSAPAIASNRVYIGSGNTPLFYCLNAFTGKEETCFYVHILDSHLKISVEVLADMVCNSLFRGVAVYRA